MEENLVFDTKEGQDDDKKCGDGPVKKGISFRVSR